jgi:glycosyltransferase involved in cell wall biosynthesis
MGVRGDAADLVTRAKAGLTCLPENPESIANSVLRLEQMPVNELDQMGANGRKFYFEELSLNVGVGRFEKIFSDIARRR